MKQERYLSGGPGLNLDDDRFLFTSESVGEGHPDKICDQISDAILDACLEVDRRSKVAVEVAIKSNFVFVFGVITTLAQLDVDSMVRRVLRDVGYDQPDMDINWETCQVMDGLEIYRPQHQNGSSNESLKLYSAGDQGLMFGYATDETPSLL